MAYWTKVQSSNIDFINYNEPSKTLYIKFVSGSIYMYYGIPKNLWDRFKTAPSKGKFFFRNIRSKPFKFKKIK